MLQDVIELVRCFICEALIPPRADRACMKCQKDLEDWPES